MKIEFINLLFWFGVCLYIFVIMDPSVSAAGEMSGKVQAPAVQFKRASRGRAIRPAIGEIRRNVSRRDLEIYKKKFNQ